MPPNVFRIKERRATAADWASVNPILAEAQFCVEVDTLKFKVGNGVDRWNDLPYRSETGATGPQGPAGPAGGVPTIQTASADVTLTDSPEELTLVMTTGASDKTATLPTAVTYPGRKIVLKKFDAGAGALVVACDGSETIDGSAGYVVAAHKAFVAVQSDGSNWMIIG